MLQHLLAWLQAESGLERSQARWARWIGRGWARLKYAYHVEPTWLETHRLDIPIDGLDPNLVGMRIVQLSDFHCSRRVNGEYLREAAEKALAERPDLIALTGDFVHHGFNHVEEVADALGCLHAPLGVWAVLGNHDYAVRHSLAPRLHPDLHLAVTNALSRRGIEVLDNRAVLVRHNGIPLTVIGLADLWSKAFDAERAFDVSDHDSRFRLVLAHNPLSIEAIGERRCDLMLSGHTHGGQVDLPRLGRVGLGKNGRRFAAGLYRHNGCWLYVNRGVGFGSFPLRYKVRPEITVLTLTADS